MKKRIFTIFVSLVTFGLLGFAKDAYAGDPKFTIRDTGFSAQFLSQSVTDPITLEAGTKKTITITFKNAGTKIWNGSGGNYLSAYTIEPKYRDSLFAGSSWISKKQSGKIPGVVLPGKNGILTLDIVAPEKTGEYVERFHLASENNTWVKNGYFYIIFKVIPKTSVATTAPTTPKEVVSEIPSEYTASLALQGRKSVTEVGGKPVELTLLYMNTGKKAWNTYSFRVVDDLGTANVGSRPVFADTTWKDAMNAVTKNIAIEEGGNLKENIIFRTPRYAGEYKLKLQLYVNGEKANVLPVEVNILVTENSPNNYQEPTFNTNIPKDVPRLEEETRIRVGLTTEGDTVQFVSFEDDYTIFNGETEMGILEKSNVAIMTHVAGVYSFKGSGVDFRTNNYIRLKPVNNEHAVFDIMKGLKDRSLAWVGPGKFTKYRGAFEYRKGQVDEQLYIVNDLLMEDYVSGMSETGTNAPVEFVKANLVAARTYAYTKKGSYPFFDVLGSTYDQLYMGYEVELYKPDVKRAADATRGYMVGYENKIVTTPYFGNSNGWTRGWNEAWGGSAKPWLVPVKAEYDAGRTRLGHGVGMSQRDAMKRAENEGLGWQELIKYYYTGVDLVLMYK